MKLIHQNPAVDMSLPLVLGSEGRGRKLVKIPNTPQATTDALGFKKVGSSVMLTKEQPGQSGCLLVLNTKHAYTRGECNGRIVLLSGAADLLAAGSFAFGDAGGLGAAPHELWHVHGPSVFKVWRTGGSHKGGGYFLCVCTTEKVLFWGTPVEMSHVLLNDTTPGLAKVVTPLLDKFDAERSDYCQRFNRPADTHVLTAVIDAIKLYESFENDLEEQATVVTHFCPGGLMKSLSDWGLQGTPDVCETKGVEVLVSSPLVRGGNDALVDVNITCGGGKRWRALVETSGLEIVRETEEPRGGLRALMRVVSEDWRVSFTRFKDGEVYESQEYSSTNPPPDYV